MTSNLKKRAIEGLVKYLERKGYDILEEIDDKYIVANDNDTLVFIKVKVDARVSKFLPKETINRDAMEVLAIKWLSEHPEASDAAVRFDAATLTIVSESQLFIRHHINALN